MHLMICPMPPALLRYAQIPVVLFLKQNHKTLNFRFDEIRMIYTTEEFEARLRSYCVQSMPKFSVCFFDYFLGKW